MSAEQIDQLQEKTQKELLMVRQRLDESLSQETGAMRCGLIKKRRDLISDMVRRTCVCWIFKETPYLIPQNLFIAYFLQSCSLLSAAPGPQTETEGPVGAVQGSGGTDRCSSAPALLEELTNSSQFGAS